MPVKSIEVSGLESALDVLKPEPYAKARRSAINEITNRSRTTASERIRLFYVIRKKDLDPKLYISKLNISTGSGKASISAGVRGFRVYLFGNPQWKRTWPGARVTIRRGIRVTIHHAFIPVLASGHKGIFARETKETKRLPINELYSIDPGGMFDQDRVYDGIRSRIDNEFDDILENRIRFYVDR